MLFDVLCRNINRLQGDLHSYLKSRDPDRPTPGVAPLTTAKVHIYAIQLASAMSYLETKFVVHSALCCKHILVQSERKIKLAGFTRPPPAKPDDNPYETDRGIKQHVRWTAIETHGGLNAPSHKSDVWSYGVTVWEMFSFGALPLQEYDNILVMDAVRRGVRPSRPKHCTRAVFDVIASCWRDSVMDRPLFSTVEKDIANATGADVDLPPSVAASPAALSSDQSHDYEYQGDDAARNTKFLDQHSYEYEAESTPATSHQYEYESEAKASKTVAKRSAAPVDLNAMFGTGDSES